jgi:hypothetical protein
LSYGPDINLSLPDWTPEQALDATRKLNFYAPWLVPFSFCSPFHAGRAWQGPSWRTFHRAPLRPAVKLFLADDALARLAPETKLVYPARIASEHGRIEFKAFDAQPSPEILAACCHLLVGVCLSDELSGRSEGADVALYQRAACDAFYDEDIYAGAGEILQKAGVALFRAGCAEGVGALECLQALRATRRTPADTLRENWESGKCGGAMVASGGLFSPALADLAFYA